MATHTTEHTAEPSITQANRDFWAQFYARHSLRDTPSAFARWCLDHHLAPTRHLLELGCGNGRDSFAMMAHGLNVLAVDGCEVAIGHNTDHLSQKNTTAGRFLAHDLGYIDALQPHVTDTFGSQPDAIYSRFFLHAVPEAVEDRILAFSHRQLPQNGVMLHEFRTTQDPLFQQGDELSATERWTDHYRRFIDTSAFRDKLHHLGFDEIAFHEGTGMATFGKEDPVVARVVVRKR